MNSRVEQAEPEAVGISRMTFTIGARPLPHKSNPLAQLYEISNPCFNVCVLSLWGSGPFFCVVLEKVS
jgi:hypothetical protein